MTPGPRPEQVVKGSGQEAGESVFYWQSVEKSRKVEWECQWQAFMWDESEPLADSESDK